MEIQLSDIHSMDHPQCKFKDTHHINISSSSPFPLEIHYATLILAFQFLEIERSYSTITQEPNQISISMYSSPIGDLQT